MYDPRRMHLFQRFQHRAHDGEGFLLRYFSALLLQILLQAHTLDVFHHNIGGVIFIEEVFYRHDAGDA